MKIVLWAAHEAGYRAYRKLYAAGHQLLIFTEQYPPYVPSVIELGRTLGQSVYVKADDDLMITKISEFRPDVGISMYYPEIINVNALAIPRLGAFNFHPALLPRHRGCFSAPWAILEGDNETGVTCHEMIAKVDSGRILCQSRVVVEKDDTAFSLYYRLVDSALVLLDDALTLLNSTPVQLHAQSQGGCYHRRAVPYNGQIDPAWPNEMVDRFIRSMYFPPHPPAMMVIAGKAYPVHTLDEYVRLRELHG